MEGLIGQLQVQVQGHLLQFPVNLLPIASADIVLGAAQLATLGPHIADYNKLLLQFYQDNHFIALHGDKNA